MFLMSTDGFANSYKNDNEFIKTCNAYFDTVRQHGIKAVKENLKSWLSETSAMGSGDDITVMMAYYSAGDNEKEINDAGSVKADFEADLSEKQNENPMSGKKISTTNSSAENKPESEVISGE